MEYVSPEGLRLDGRRPMEMRQLRAELGAVSGADGSAVFEMGNTKVIAAVYGPREVQNRSQQISDQALVYALLRYFHFQCAFDCCLYCAVVCIVRTVVILESYFTCG
uniref:Exosome complex component RRP41 isoform X2 n=1 Tax=Rhizophora mucronata TaxID=61149 RepID=A0A2P2L8N5_RHIMU